MPAFDTLQPAGFGSITFPVASCDVMGGIREHVHEYPHSPGGAIEKLGRKLYEIRMSAPFHNTFRKWPGLWPGKLASLRNFFEAQVTTDLVIPTIGTIRAVCTGWVEHMTAGKRSGVDVELTFREDQSNEFLVEALVSAKAADVTAATAEAIALIEDAEFEMDIFDGIQELASDLTSIVDQVNTQSDLLDAKLQGLEHNVRTVLDTVPDLAKPRNHPLAAALRAVGVAAIEAREDLLKAGAPVITWVTPRRMSVVEVSIAVYGDTSHAVEVMAMNALDDPYSITQGTALRVYAPPDASAA